MKVSKVTSIKLDHEDIVKAVQQYLEKELDTEIKDSYLDIQFSSKETIVSEVSFVRVSATAELII